MGALNEGSGVSYFHYDPEFKLIIVAGRGDNVSPVYSFDKSSPTIIQPLYTHNYVHTTQKMFSVMSNHCVDVGKQEIMRALRVNNTNKLEVI